MPEDDTSNSGYLDAPFENMGRTFTDITIMRKSELNVVARAKRYGRWWLLKALRPDLSAQSAYQLRLRKEMELMMRLQHPAIVSAVGMEQVEALGESIVMEYVEGKTLRQVLDEGSTTRAQRREIAADLLDAVDYLHAMGVVHRDLKPQNVMVATNGMRVKIVDFGLADTDSYAVLKQPAGTPRYMSPEQREEAVADMRNDIYSLGVIFGQMDLGRAFARLIRKCLLPANRRYQTVSEMRRGFRHCLARRRRVAAALTAMALVALLAVVGVMAWQLGRQRDVVKRQERLLAEQDERLAGQQQRMASLEHEAAGTKNRQDEQLRTIATLNDSLGRLAASNKQMREQREAEEARRRVVEGLKKDAETMLRNIYRKVGEQRIDRVDPKKKIGVMFSTAIESEKQRFLKEIRSQVSDSEYIEISVFIGDYCDQLATSTWGSLGFRESDTEANNHKKQ